MKPRLHKVIQLEKLISLSRKEKGMSKKSAATQPQRFKDGLLKAAKAKDRKALEKLFHEDYYLLTHRGEIIDRESLLDGVLQSNANYADFLCRVPVHTRFQSEGDTIREVSEINLNGNGSGQPVETAEGAVGNYIYTAIYLRGEKGDLRVIASTVNKIEPPRIGKPNYAQ
jgi:uncharacterized protein DUF4440